MLLELLTAHSRDDLRPFHGHVTAMQLLGSDGGYARYRLTIEPWTAFLTHRHDAYVFQDMSVIDITESVFADYAAQGALVPQCRWELADKTVYAKRSQCVQFDESDWDFLQRLWAEEGLFAWFAPPATPRPWAPTPWCWPTTTALSRPTPKPTSATPKAAWP